MTRRNSGSRTISPKVKFMLYLSTGGRCWYCGHETVFPYPRSRAKTTYYYYEVDHVVSPLNGGSNAIDNLRPSCRSCNKEKANLHENFLRDYLDKRARFRWSPETKDANGLPIWHTYYEESTEPYLFWGEKNAEQIVLNPVVSTWPEPHQSLYRAIIRKQLAQQKKHLAALARLKRKAERTKP